MVEPPDDDSLSSEQLIWLVEKGDIIFYGKWIQKSIKLRLKTTDPRGSTSIIFIANDSDRIPGRIMNNDFRSTSVDSFVILHSALSADGVVRLLTC